MHNINDTIEIGNYIKSLQDNKEKQPLLWRVIKSEPD